MRDEPKLILTGYRENRRHLVKLLSLDVWLCSSTFAVLCVLAYARLSTQTGACRVDKRIVRRLRREIDQAFDRDGFGKTLIQCGDYKEYLLSSKLDVIRIDRSFRELDVPGFDCTEIVLKLQNLCPDD